jgi:HEAT repeat protein
MGYNESMGTIPVTVEIQCGGGRHPIQVSIAFWGEVLAPNDPFSMVLGQAFARMVPQECYQRYHRLVQELELSAPLMTERVLLQGHASHDNPTLHNCWQALLDACAQAESIAQQILQDGGDARAYEWALAVVGSEAMLADYLDKKPLRNWERGNQLWLLRRAISGDRRVWKFLWERLPQIRDSLQENASLVALAMGLGQSQSDYAWDTLEPLIEHPDPSVRVAATDAVAQLGETRALNPLRHRIQSEQEQAVVNSVIRALGAIGETQDASNLIDHGFRHPAYRAAVRDALIRLGNKSVPAIADAMRDLPDDTMKERLLESLQGIATPEVVPILDRVVRQSDRRRLCLGAVSVLRSLSLVEVIPSLIYALGDSSHQVRQEAFAAIVERGTVATDLLLDALQNPQQWSPKTRFVAQWSVARALARIGGDTVKQTLMELAESYDLNQRWAAITALRYADYSDLSEWMAARLQGSPWTIQHECALYLWRYPAPDTIPALMDAINNPSPMLREVFERAVVRNGLEAIPVLQARFREWDTFPQKQSLVHILRQIGHPAGWSILEELAQDDDARIARAAKEALNTIPTGM